MQLNLLHENLVQKIQTFGVSAQETRQVYRRLQQLFDERVQKLVKDQARNGIKVADAQRLVFLSDEYCQLVDELTEVLSQSFESRIQYETHMMLLDARKSQRKYRR